MTQQLRGEQFFEPSFPLFLNRETESFKLSRHTHDFIELSLVAEGRGYQFIDEQTLQVSKGDVFVLPLGTSHVFRPSSVSGAEPLVIYNCIFRAELLQEIASWRKEPDTLAAQLLDSSADRCADHRVPDADARGDRPTAGALRQEHSVSSLQQRWYSYHDRNGNLLQLFSSAYYEYSKRDAYARPMLLALLAQILIQIERLHGDKHTRAAGSEQPPSAMDDALHYIHRHYNEKLTLKKMSELTYMSESHFQQHFKRLTSQSFTHYVQTVRIEKSCQLLQSTALPVQEIAAEVGYSDMKFYHALFRKLTGVTPHAYRKGQGQQG